MTASDVWADPFDPEVQQQFFEDSRARLGAGAVTTARTLRYDFMVADDDVGTIQGPAEFDVIGLASDRATAAGPTDNTAPATNGWPGSETTRPQEPRIGADGLVPQGTMILIGGVGMVTMCSQIQAPGRLVATTALANPMVAAAVADDQLSGIMAAIDASTIKISDQRTEKGFATGHEFASWGSSRFSLWGPATDDAAAVPVILYGGQVTLKDRGWKRLDPIYLDGGGAGIPQSQLRITMEVPRSTNWPLRADTRMRWSVLLPSLVSYVGSAGPSNCDPPAGAPPGGLPPPYGKAIQPGREGPMMRRRRWG